MHHRSPWLDLGLAWASGWAPATEARVARALLRWDTLSPTAREALRLFACGVRSPAVDDARELAAVGLIELKDDRPALAYPGVGLIALELERKNLTPALSGELLGWYRGAHFRLRRTYHRSQQERPRDAHEAFVLLERARLVEQAFPRMYRSTLRGWAVARLVEDALGPVVVDEDGPTRPRMAATVGGV